MLLVRAVMCEKISASASEGIEARPVHAWSSSSTHKSNESKTSVLKQCRQRFCASFLAKHSWAIRRPGPQSLSSFGRAFPASGPHFCQSGFPKLSRATDDAEQVRTVGLHLA